MQTDAFSENHWIETSDVLSSPSMLLVSWMAQSLLILVRVVKFSLTGENLTSMNFSFTSLFCTYG